MVHRNAYCINTCSSLDNKISIANFRTAEMIGRVEEGYTETGKQRASSEFPNTSSVEVLCIPLGLFLTPLEMYHIHIFFLLDVKEAEFSIHKMIFIEVGGYHEIHIGGLDVVFGRI